MVASHTLCGPPCPLPPDRSDGMLYVQLSLRQRAMAMRAGSKRHHRPFHRTRGVGAVARCVGGYDEVVRSQGGCDKLSGRRVAPLLAPLMGGDRSDKRGRVSHSGRACCLGVDTSASDVVGGCGQILGSELPPKGMNDRCATRRASGNRLQQRSVVTDLLKASRRHALRAGEYTCSPCDGWWVVGLEG